MKTRCEATVQKFWCLFLIFVPLFSRDAVATIGYVPTARPDAVLYHHVNGYDAGGNLLFHKEIEQNRTIDPLSPARTRITANTYDAVYRLAEERVFIDGTLDSAASYSYDDRNNRTALQRDNDGDGIDDESFAYQIGGWNMIQSFTHHKDDLENGGAEDRIVTFGYDGAGRRQQRDEVRTLTPDPAVGGGSTVENQTTRYFYNVEDRLTGVEITKDAQPPSLFAYRYDYRGRRVVRDETGATVPTTPEDGEIVPDAARTTVVFSGGTSVQEYDGATVKKEYIRGSDYGGGIGGLLYSLDATGTLSLNHFNARGDIVAKSDATGAFTWKADYEAFGTRPEESGQNFQLLSLRWHAEVHRVMEPSRSPSLEKVADAFAIHLMSLCRENLTQDITSDQRHLIHERRRRVTQWQSIIQSLA